MASTRIRSTSIPSTTCGSIATGGATKPRRRMRWRRRRRRPRRAPGARPPAPRSARTSSMVTFIVRRVLLMVPTLWAIATLAFFLVRGAPGGPFQSEKEIPAVARAQLMRRYGLDQPLHVQYVRFLGGVARLD